MSYYGIGSHDDTRGVKQHTRRPHRKTRNGCFTCKKRKIKCDEQKPKCDNCIKHSLTCEYAPVQPPSGFQDVSVASRSLNLIDLELLHHFCTSTALISANDNPTIRTLWSTNVPKLGFQYDYVMHGILACSALHLALSRPEKKDLLVTQASLHYHAGLQKGTSALATYSDENVSAIYIFSVLTVMYNIASAHLSDRALLRSDDGNGIAEWIILLRQSYGIVKISLDVLLRGPIGQLFNIGIQRASLQDQVALNGFPGAERLRTLSAHIEETVDDSRSREAYKDAISALLKCYAVVYGTTLDKIGSSDLFVWPFKVSEDYLGLLQNSSQEALLILAYFAVLTTRASLTWWAQGFGDRLMSVICPLIDTNHKAWMEWPIKEMNQKPDEAWVTSDSRQYQS